LGETITQVIREVPKPNKSYKRLSIRSHAKGTFHQYVDDPKKIAMDKLYIVNENDLIVNITFAWEHAIAIAKKSDNGLLVSHRFPTYEIDNSDVNFIRILVTQEAFRVKMDLISPGGAGRNRVLSKQGFIKIPIIIPNKAEQAAIGNFFRILDDVITLHKRKLDKLKELKKGYLQQMFPQEGESVPRVRFAGFKGDWEEKKLGEVVDVNSGKDYKHLGTGDIPVYGTGGYMLSVNEKLSDKDAIGIGRKGTIDKPQILKAPFWTVDTLFFVIPKSENHLYFLFSMFETINWKTYDESTGVPSLSKATIVDISKMLPPLCEQIVVGNFFRNFDKQITEHQIKLGKLKLLKTAYLQKMFI